MQVLSTHPPDKSYVHITVDEISDLALRQLYNLLFDRISIEKSDTAATYIVPTALDKDTGEIYRKAMDQIIQTYTHVREKLQTYIEKEDVKPPLGQTSEQLAAEVAGVLLPVSRSLSVRLEMSLKQAKAAQRVMATSNLSEMQELALHLQKLLSVTDTAAPDNASTPSHQPAQDISKLIEDHLQAHSIDHTESVRLEAASVRSELDLLPTIIYPHSNLSYEELGQQLGGWTIDRKIDIYQAYIQNQLGAINPSSALGHLSYLWDIVTDYSSFRQLQETCSSINVWQALTPRYGFDVPRVADDAGLVEVYETCYELSFTLYNALHERGFAETAEYAVLQGHKLRTQLHTTAHALMAFLRDPRSVHFPLATTIHERLAEIHPILAENISK